MIRKKNPYHAPEEVVVDGTKIKLHYSRKDRLALAGRSLFSEDDNCFFCKKNRMLHIMLLNFILLGVLGFIFVNFYGKAKAVKIDEMEYYFSKKVHSNQETVYFTLDLRNRSDITKNLEKPELFFYITNADKLTVYKKNFTVTKTVFKPDEYYIENIIVDTLGPGEYIAYLDTKQGTVLDLKFRLQEEK